MVTRTDVRSVEDKINMENRHINIPGQLNFHKDAKVIQWENKIFPIKDSELDIHTEKREP